ncbi:MAG TPA: nuclear transport factor 2 family protein [Actinomycetes bacterium]|nr:nuclear transport factor 2 family protein [Actinomycetes bacterium]
MPSHEPVSALEPGDLERLYVQRVNAGDVDGLVALFEPDAVVAFAPGQMATGSQAIRQLFTDLVGSGVQLTFTGQQRTLRVGDLALTSTRLHSGDATAEIARRQPDGTWRWVIDQWSVLCRRPVDGGPGSAGSQPPAD